MSTIINWNASFLPNFVPPEINDGRIRCPDRHIRHLRPQIRNDRHQHNQPVEDMDQRRLHKEQQRITKNKARSQIVHLSTAGHK